MDINYQIMQQGTWKEYDGQTYFTKEGKRLDVQTFEAEYPVVMAEKTAILTLGLTLLDVATFNMLKAYYGIDQGKTEAEVLEIVQRERIKEASESSPLERIAAALEYIELSMMEGKAYEL